MWARKVFGKPHTEFFGIGALRLLHRAGGVTLVGGWPFQPEPPLLPGRKVRGESGIGDHSGGLGSSSAAAVSSHIGKGVLHEG